MIAASSATTFSDVCLFLAVVLFVVEAILIAVKAGGNHGWLLPLGAAFFAGAFLALSVIK